MINERTINELVLRATLLGFHLEDDVDGGWLEHNTIKHSWMSLPYSHRYYRGIGCTRKGDKEHMFHNIDDALNYFEGKEINSG